MSGFGRGEQQVSEYHLRRKAPEHKEHQDKNRITFLSGEKS